MGHKYEFTGETKNYEGHLLHRIRRISDDRIGGWIEKEDNLSQEGGCFVYDEAKVYDNAEVYGNVVVNMNAEVYGNAKVYSNAMVWDNAKIYGDAEVYGNAYIYSDARVYGNAKIEENVKVYGYARVCRTAWVYGNAEVYDKAWVYGNAEVYGHAKVSGDTEVAGDAKVYGDAKITSGNYFTGKFFTGEFFQNEDSSKKNFIQDFIQDFIYKVNDSNKIFTQTEYDSIDEFFSEPIKNDVKLDTLVICTVDTKEPLIKLQKVKTDDRSEFKFIVDIINEDGDNFMFKSIIKSQEQLNDLIQRTIEALKLYPQFYKYAEDLENCL